MAMNPDVMRMQMDMFKQTFTDLLTMFRTNIPQAQDPLQTLRNAKEILGMGNAPAPNPMDEITKTFMQAAITKLLNPPESNAFKDTMGLINDIKAAGFMGAAPAKPDLMSTFAANLPMIADRVVSGLHEFRLQAEAQERTVRLSRGEMRPNDPRTITVDPPSPATQATAGVPAEAPAPGAEAGRSDTSQSLPPGTTEKILVEANLQKLVLAMKDPECTGEDIYHFLFYVWPALLQEMSGIPKEHLLMLFRSAEIQKERLGNTILLELADDPRLPRMIDEFLIVAKRDQQPAPPAAQGAV
jgi:hypothetical protein